jgi:hypothetical protein
MGAPIFDTTQIAQKISPLLDVHTARVQASSPDAPQYHQRDDRSALGRVPHCTPDDVTAAAQRARAVQRQRSARPGCRRLASGIVGTDARVCRGQGWG